MKKIAVYAILAGAGGLFGFQTQAQSRPDELGTALPTATQAGQATMSVWGFGVYQATLWVTPGFAQAAYAQSTFGLELAYLRDFSGADIARRSLQEMRRQTAISATDASRWEAQMRALFPDVKAGDRITGVHQGGSGAAFWANGRKLGEVADPLFARLFFGIWLSPNTSEPKLRLALLAGTP